MQMEREGKEYIKALGTKYTVDSGVNCKTYGF